ncbi:MliC family protein [Gimibacter soli]|uniref:MliC family protein n=1 Tax=Gimibacter soli TaxID=3024400 RepID=A0AAF0BM42_9PROT|nr:MliC family protein [Gimibacter soli]WCL55007.1 MliC family protein [Gimibacter soli]
MQPRTLALIAALSLSLTACDGPEGEKLPDEKATATWVLNCDGAGRMVVREVPGKIWLFLDSETLELPQAEAASGVRYTNDQWTAWAKGRDIMMLKDGNRLECVNDARAAVWEHAKLNGVDFRATGNESGWLLEISNGDQLHLVTDYGATVIDASLPVFAESPEGLAARYTVETDDHMIDIELVSASCTDTMSGDAFETAVTIMLDGQKLTGCGRPLH